MISILSLSLKARFRYMPGCQQDQTRGVEVTTETRIQGPDRWRPKRDVELLLKEPDEDLSIEFDHASVLCTDWWAVGTKVSFGNTKGESAVCVSQRTLKMVEAMHCDLHFQ